MAEKPPFDPTQPFSEAPSVSAPEKPPFDPSQSYQPLGQAVAKPPFDPSQPYTAGTAAPDQIDTSGPMPGFLEAAQHGLRQSVVEGGQSGQALQGMQPTPVPQAEGPEAQGFEWRDLVTSRGLSKIAYQTGANAPTLAAGMLGAGAGSFISPVGTAVGGAGGAALGAAFQAIGPSFAAELKRTPQDPDGAWGKAVEESLASGAFSGASWAAYPLRIPYFQAGLKKLAFQALGVQPAIGVAQQATKNVIEGESPGKDLGQAYASGAVMTAVPALGHLALTGRFGEPAVKRTELTDAEITQQVAEHRQLAVQYDQQAQAAQAAGGSAEQIRKLQAISQDHSDIAATIGDRQAAQQRAPLLISQAEQFEEQAKNPALNPIQQRNLLDYAKGLREGAREDGFIGSVPPPLTVPSRGLWGRIKESYLNNIDPSMRSEAATKADPQFGKYAASKAQAEDSITARGEATYRQKWTKVPFPDQMRWYALTELGSASLPADLLDKYPWMDQARRDYRIQLDTAARLEGEAGSKQNFVENYLPHLYEDTGRAQQLFNYDNLVKTMGANWFSKERTYELMQMAEADGLKPKFNNVQDFINARLMSGADMLNKTDLLHNLQSIGVAHPMETAPAHIKNPSLVGSPFKWQEVISPMGEKWLIAPDIQALWKNAIKPGEGLWSSPGAAGDAFRTWMKFKSAWVPVKLMASAFHLIHVAHIDNVNNMSRALRETFGRGQQGMYRRIWAPFEAIGQTLRNAVAVPEEMLRAVSFNYFKTPRQFQHLGREMREAWLTPREDQTPDQAAQVKLMTDAGISAQLSEQLRVSGKREFQEAIQNNQYLKTVYPGIRASIAGLQHWMFEEWIPNLKMAALQREAEALFRRRPDLVGDTTNRQVALRALGKQIDSRFGEMTYGSLFWNRTLKDASIGSFLSLGWNLGFAREFGGGFFEPIVRRMIDPPNPTRALIRDTTTKTANMFMYVLTAAAINATMNHAFTGEWPDGWLDYVFPRIGGLNPDGSPRRITNAFYTREVPMLAKNIEEQQSVIGGLTQMLYHKMMFGPFVEMLKNRDYFGSQIMDENAPFYQQMGQLGKYIVTDQASPMSISGAKRALQLSGKPFTTLDVFKQLAAGDRDVVLPLMGFGPAPGYASKSAMENRIMYLFKQYVVPESKSFDVGAKAKEKSDARIAYLGALQSGDKAKQTAAALALGKLGVATRDINKLQPGGSLQYMFGRLPYPDQKNLLANMSKEEFRTYFPVSAFAPKKHGHPKYDPQVTALAQKYYAASP